MSQPCQFPEPPRELRSRRILDAFRFFGPGIIVASVTIGSGETVWASRSGAVFGYNMFWAFTLFCVMKAIQVYAATRYFTLTGEHPAQRWAQLPGPRAWLPAVIGVLTVIAFPFYLAALSILLGTITSWIVTGDPQSHPHLWATVFSLLFIGMTYWQSYRFFEKMQTGIVALMLLVMLLATVAAKPDWLAALVGMVWPTAPRYEDWIRTEYPEVWRRTLWVELVAYMGVIGGGVQDYVGYVGMLREKRWGLVGVASDTSAGPAVDPENVRRGRAWLRAPLLDVAFSFGTVAVFCAVFMVLGAELLHQRHLVPSEKAMELYTKQVVFLTDLHHNQTLKFALSWLYRIGIWCAIAGTVYGTYEIYVRNAYECARAVSTRWRTIPIERYRVWILWYTGVGGIAMVWASYATGWGPLSIMTIPLHVTGVLLAGPWCFAMVWTDRKFLPKPFQMNRLLVILNLICGIAFTMFGVRALYDDVLALLRVTGISQ